MNENDPAVPDEDFANAVVAADDTGMVRGEQLIVQTEMDEQLPSPDR